MKQVAQLHLTKFRNLVLRRVIRGERGWQCIWKASHLSLCIGWHPVTIKQFCPPYQKTVEIVVEWIFLKFFGPVQHQLPTKRAIWSMQLGLRRSQLEDHARMR